MKSHFFAEMAIERCLAENTRIVCIREVQKSIKQSVKRLLEDKIIAMGVEQYFTVLESEIKHKTNGSFIIFQGMQNHTADSIKSLEAFDVAWWEEAQTASSRSLKLLIPTIIRKPAAELWFSWNPEFDDAPIEDLLRGNNPVDGAIVVYTSYEMNPFLTKEVLAMIEAEKKRSPKDFAHIYGGDYKTIIDGAIFSDELAKLNTENRLTKVPISPGIPIHTFWDLGQSDNTAIWFVQIVGMEYRIIDYYQSSGVRMSHYIEMLAEKGYKYGEHCLPHDAEHEQLSAQSTIKQQLQNALRDNQALGQAVRIVPRIPKKALGIEAARSIFGQCVFDKEKTKDGLQCLRHYAYANDPEAGKVSKEPKHDAWSHGSDAFLCFAQNFKRPTHTKPKSIMMG